MACGWHVTYGVFAVEFSNEMEDSNAVIKTIAGRPRCGCIQHRRLDETLLCIIDTKHIRYELDRD